MSAFGDIMHEDALDKTAQFLVTHEGCRDHMYLDVDGNVTAFVGHLVTGPSEAAALPWCRDGHLAKQDYHELKRLNFREPNKERPYTHARADGKGIASVLIKDILAKATQAKKTYPTWSKWPADAQMATVVYAFATGNFGVNMHAALQESPPNFLAAAENSWIKNLPKRSAWLKKLFQTADKVRNDPGLYPELVWTEGLPLAGETCFASPCPPPDGRPLSPQKNGVDTTDPKSKKTGGGPVIVGGLVAVTLLFIATRKRR